MKDQEYSIINTKSDIDADAYGPTHYEIEAVLDEKKLRPLFHNIHFKPRDSQFTYKLVYEHLIVRLVVHPASLDNMILCLANECGVKLENAKLFVVKNGEKRVPLPKYLKGIWKPGSQHYRPTTHTSVMMYYLKTVDDYLLKANR
jgi:hypothetical protein